MLACAQSTCLRNFTLRKNATKWISHLNVGIEAPGLHLGRLQHLRSGMRGRNIQEEGGLTGLLGN